jgi:response regulator RpfG family c-di-GMP phosphodiesterase
VSQSQALAATGAMKYKILFVDDCSTTSRMEQMLFAKRTDHNLIMARNGQEALEKAISELPDLILMEASLPNMKACREMRKVLKLQRVPILLLTNYGALPSEIENSFDSESHDVPATSLKWRDLFERVNTYLTAHGINP